jgi:AcrR family transcriptional regulator
MVGIRAATAEQTRRRIVAAARRLFSDPGYHAVGTATIVAEAGVGTRGALYHHFEDKRALFMAVFEEVEVDLLTRAAGAIRGATSLDRLRDGLDSFLDASREPEVRRILFIDGPAVLGWDAWREIEARYGLGAIREVLEQGQGDGSMTVTDPDAMAHLLLSAVDEAALYIAHAKHPRRARAEAGRALAALISGLAASRPTAAPARSTPSARRRPSA